MKPAGIFYIEGFQRHEGIWFCSAGKPSTQLVSNYSGTGISPKALDPSKTNSPFGNLGLCGLSPGFSIPAMSTMKHLD
jgi:hypothetical protein